MRKKIVAFIAALLPIASFAGPVDINTADAMTLAQELNGVGLSRAEAIVEYREEHGAFKAPEDLLNVKGIGLQVYEVNRTNILVGKSSS